LFEVKRSSRPLSVLFECVAVENLHEIKKIKILKKYSTSLNVRAVTLCRMCKS